jgi:hypothetical protein
MQFHFTDARYCFPQTPRPEIKENNSISLDWDSWLIFYAWYARICLFLILYRPIFIDDDHSDSVGTRLYNRDQSRMIRTLHILPVNRYNDVSFCLPSINKTKQRVFLRTEWIANWNEYPWTFSPSLKFL